MKTTRQATIVRLSAPQRARLDRMAKRLDRPRVVLMREALDEYLARCERKEVPRGTST